MFVNTLSFATNAFMSFEGIFKSERNPSPSTVVPGEGDICLNLLTEFGEGSMFLWMIRANNTFSSQPNFFYKLLAIVPTEPEDFAIYEKFFLGITSIVKRNEIEKEMEYLNDANKSSYDQGVAEVRKFFDKDISHEQIVDVGMRLWKGYKNMVLKSLEIGILKNRIRVMDKNGEDVYNGGKAIDFMLTDEAILKEYAERVSEKTNGYFTKGAMAEFLIKLHKMYKELSNKM